MTLMLLLLVNEVKLSVYFVFFFNDTATTEIYTLSLHDALPIYGCRAHRPPVHRHALPRRVDARAERSHGADRKSTRLNSSHGYISYAVFCLKKKRKTQRYPCESTLSSGPRQSTEQPLDLAAEIA